MIIKTVTYRNFKGLKEFTVDLNGKSVTISGANEAGKTTLADGIWWLFFGKDLNNRTDFSVKPLDATGAASQGAEVSVEAVTDAGTFKRTYREVWARKRGAEAETFSGHTTDYEINGVPASDREYKTAVAEIVGEEQFKLLTNPVYFASMLKWQKRREIILAICGDVSDEDVISQNAELAELRGILGDVPADKYRKMLDARRKAINDEQSKIPARIDQENKGLYTDDLTVEELRQQAADIQAEVSAITKTIASIESGEEIQRVETEIARLEVAGESKAAKELAKKRDELSKLQRDATAHSIRLANLRQQIVTKTAEIERHDDKVAALDCEMKELQRKYMEAYKADYGSLCPTCGQDMPAGRVAESRARALATITEDGKAKEAELKAAIESRPSLDQELQEAQEIYAAAEKSGQAFADGVKTLETMIRNAESDEPQGECMELTELRGKLSELQADTAAAAELAKAKQVELENDLSEIRRRIAGLESNAFAHKRIDGLKARQKELAKEWAQTERELHLLDEHTRARVRVLESAVNARFKMARFQMFRDQINGGVQECCEVTYNGVPYNGGLNTGARILVGLDIIETLQKHYGLSMPVFVDNAEAITSPIECDVQQVVKLVAVQRPKNLKVEVAA